MEADSRAPSFALCYLYTIVTCYDIATTLSVKSLRVTLQNLIGHTSSNPAWPKKLHTTTNFHILIAWTIGHNMSCTFQRLIIATSYALMHPLLVYVMVIYYDIVGTTISQGHVRNLPQHALIMDLMI